MCCVIMSVSAAARHLLCSLQVAAATQSRAACRWQRQRQGSQPGPKATCLEKSCECWHPGRQAAEQCLLSSHTLCFNSRPSCCFMRHVQPSLLKQPYQAHPCFAGTEALSGCAEWDGSPLSP